ncbi:glutathione S-transferase family protein [Rhizobium lentis]|uniref:glutathione S-transferase family protein n=1 Tax=Rhizobium lentis TaxID=1138194 RepID=UPI001C8293D9|nr:glutathione S-transferase family protein [Rhizobium lentis]MBX5040833.1 glutathione S-transferase family protein [Rhizobium lentis]MBX5047209.1 glutathione S-transferase family protein [Rhizobium lentis]MBX5053823.1 glutathione S-transferase family protein [Rhizobium lentis]MBX5059221.1 glutathione S-transferase family protein [Rhizobium lentis]MBX5070026.1 glutathione S-transferase family protein [Rhizobium lentis]
MRKPTLISHHLCPYVQRVAIALHEKGVSFERINIDLADKPDWFLKISPLSKVPLLRIQEDDGREEVLFESSVICEYLEETQPGAGLHPADPLTRARHRGWMEFGSSVLSDLWGYETASDKAQLDAKREALAAKFATLERALADGPYFSGKNFSLVDAVFAPVFRYFDVFDRLGNSGIFDGLERVTRWRNALSERGSVQDAVGEDYPQRLMQFLEKHNSVLLKQSVAA